MKDSKFRFERVMKTLSDWSMPIAKPFFRQRVFHFAFNRSYLPTSLILTHGAWRGTGLLNYGDE
jgi:hypothetical protein